MEGSKTNSSIAKRQNEFKKGVSVEDARRRREDVSVQLRKEKKEEGIAKRRNMQILSGETQNEPSPQSSVEDSQDSNSSNSTLRSMQALFVTLQTGNPEQQVASVKGFRRLLSIEKNPPVKECIEIGVLPFLVAALQRSDMPELQFEAAWALTNIASTNYTKVVAQSGAVPLLAQLLASPTADIREQCAWCLGNIAGDSAELRDLVLANNALPNLLANIAQPASLSLLRNCTWSLSNLCRGKPAVALELIVPALSSLAQLIIQQVDADTMVDAAWALSYISDGNDNRIQSVVNSHEDLLPALVKMMASGNSAMVVPALRTIGNIATGNEKQTQAVINAQALPALAPLLTHSKKNIRKEVCWVLSNVAAGSMKQMLELFSVPELIPRVLQQLSASAEWDVRREAAWVISNIATSAPKAQLHRLLEHGVVNHLCELLGVGEVKIVLITLDALEAFLKLGQQNTFVDVVNLVHEAGGVDTLEKLQEHENNTVYERAVHIIEKYFCVEEDKESENIAPATTGNVFSFGMPTTGKPEIDFGSKFFQQQENNPSQAQNQPFQFSF